MSGETTGKGKVSQADIDALDEDLFAKLPKGIDALGTKDLSQGAEMALGLVPGAPGYALQAGARLANGLAAGSEEAAVYNKLGIRLNGQSKALQRKRQEMEAKPTTGLAKLAAQIGGALTGVLVVGAIITALAIPTVPLLSPLIGLAGALGGGFLGGTLGTNAFEYFFEKQEQDAVKNTAKTQTIINNGGQVDELRMFVDLTSTFPDEKPINEKLEVALEQLTAQSMGKGTRDFALALKSPEGRDAIREIMQSKLGQEASDTLRNSLGIVSDDPLLSIFAQAADMFNRKLAEPVDLVKNPAKLAQVSNQMLMDKILAEDNVPEMPPEVGSLARNMSKMGVVPGGGSNAGSLPQALAGNSRQV